LREPSKKEKDAPNWWRKLPRFRFIIFLHDVGSPEFIYSWWNAIDEEQERKRKEEEEKKKKDSKKDW
jgi:hypothetical protein